MPDWADILVSGLSAGQFWPEGSESLLRQLSELYTELQGVLTEAANDGAGAYNVIRSGWDSPAALTFDQVADNLFTGFNSEVMALADNVYQYASQSSAFAQETEYTKISINVAFWVTITALFITVLALFWTGVGPAAAAAAAWATLQTVIRSLIAKLGLIWARQLTIKAASQAGVTAVKVAMTNLGRNLGTRAATGIGGVPSQLVSTLKNPAVLGRELFEEITEETFIDAATQAYQINALETRDSWDWQKTQASAIGAATGAVVGTFAGPLSAALPVGKPIRVGLNNMIASPAGSFMANGLVYDNWTNPFTATSLAGAFMGGAGRFYGNSPFDPNTYTQFTNGGVKPPDPAEGIPLPDPSPGGPSGPGGNGAPVGGPSGNAGSGPSAGPRAGTGGATPPGQGGA
ncbi:MAG: hypothetical protein H0U22_10825, partial [Geodermatophilaceae bacterium]|nr:hypothetical protein [Geodermatophilaceae bacterium]